MNRPAAPYRAGHLGNDIAGEEKIGMLAAVFHQGFRGVLRCGDVQIRDKAAADGVRVVEVDGLADKIGAIARDELVGFAVGLRIVAEPPGTNPSVHNF